MLRVLVLVWYVADSGNGGRTMCRRRIESSRWPSGRMRQRRAGSENGLWKFSMCWRLMTGRFRLVGGVPLCRSARDMILAHSWLIDLAGSRSRAAVPHLDRSTRQGKACTGTAGATWLLSRNTSPGRESRLGPSKRHPISRGYRRRPGPVPC